jgi:RHS repeat-associated protein
VGGVVVPFVRDSQGRITQITDLNQNNYVYAYDSPCGTGNLCSVTFPGAPTIQATYTYFSDHSLNTLSDPNGNATAYTYYADGRVQSITTPSVPAPGGTQTQFITQYCYTEESSCSINTANTTKVTNPDGGVVTTVVDSFGNPLSVTDALQNTTTYSYYPTELLQSVTDPLQNPATQYAYDANNFLASITDPLGHKTTWINNQFGGVTQQTDAANQNTTSILYDSFFNPATVTDTLGPVWSRTYDSMGNILTQSDANGNTTQFTYDSRGNLIKQVDAMNEVTTFTYDGMNRMLTKTDPRGNLTTYTYDPLGNLIDTTDAIGHDIRATYDLNGNKTSDIDALGRITSYSYDALNRVIKTTYPDNTTKQYTYDFRNNKLTEIDQSLRTNQYQYYLDGRLKSVTHAVGTSDAGTVQYTYDKDGNLTVTDEVNNPTTYFYDAANRRFKTQDAKNEITQYGYDLDNRLTAITDGNLHTTTYGPDPRGRIILVTYPDRSTDHYVYDGEGNRTQKNDQANNPTKWSYDAVNRLSSVTDALLNLTKYGHDPASNLTSITDANNHVTSFQYDSLNRKALRQLPVGMVETFSYDPVGNLSAKTDFNGKTTTYTYDVLNHAHQKIPDPSLSQPTITFTYYPTGTRQTMADATGTTNYTYDNRDRLKTKATPEGTLSYTYDAHGNLLTIASSNANGASVTYTPDQLNRLSTVTDSRMAAQGVTSPITNYGYDAAGNLTGPGYSANGLQSTYTYDTLNRLSQVTWKKGTTTVASFGYTPYLAGNVHTVTEVNGRNVTYNFFSNYMLQNEIVASDPGGNNGQESYTYDAVGNRKTLTSTIPSLSGSVSYNYDANDRLTTDSYDNNGNTISSSGISYTYDFENRMLMKGALVMVYDGDGNRASETVGTTTTKYLVDTLNPTGYSQVMDELVNGAVTRTYTYGLRPISENQLVGSTWTPSFYGNDGHGNVRFLGNTAGTVTDTYQFDAFGAQIASTGTTPNPYLYSGERFDTNLNLYHLRDRYYNMLTGRFETADAYEGDITYPGSLHKYVYTANDPIDSVDPSGDLALEYTWLNTVKNRVYILAIHGAHHPFVYPILGTLWCVHSQLTSYTPGVSGSGTIDWRIPLFPLLCTDTKNIPW